MQSRNQKEGKVKYVSSHRTIAVCRVSILLYLLLGPYYSLDMSLDPLVRLRWFTPTPHLQAVALTLGTDVALFPGDRQNADNADGKNGK